jgi:hypothetical protein
VSGFGICETKLRIATTDALKQFNGSRKDLVCKKALRKEDVLQAVDERCQRTSLAALGEWVVSNRELAGMQRVG